MSAQSAAGSGSSSVFMAIKFAVLPIAKVFTMCFMGFLMASKYFNVLLPNGRKLLNGVSDELGCFCFSFTSHWLLFFHVCLFLFFLADPTRRFQIATLSITCLVYISRMQPAVLCKREIF